MSCCSRRSSMGSTGSSLIFASEVEASSPLPGRIRNRKNYRMSAERNLKGTKTATRSREFQRKEKKNLFTNFTQFILAFFVALQFTSKRITERQMTCIKPDLIPKFYTVTVSISKSTSGELFLNVQSLAFWMHIKIWKSENFLTDFTLFTRVLVIRTKFIFHFKAYVKYACNVVE